MPFGERSLFSGKLAEALRHHRGAGAPQGHEPDKLLGQASRCWELGVDAINVPDGPRAMARMSALATACLIEQRVGLETVMHFACRDRNLLGMQSDLLGAAALGLRNLLAITGDPPKLGPYPKATAVFDVDSIGLVNIVSRLNSGQDLGGAHRRPRPSAWAWAPTPWPSTWSGRSPGSATRWRPGPTGP